MLIAIFLVVFSLGIYFIPTLIAVGRPCRHLAGIVLLNFFLGWTFVGWVGALIWAVSDSRGQIGQAAREIR